MSSLQPISASTSTALQAPKRTAPLDVAMGDLRYTPHIRRNAALAIGVGASLAGAVISATIKRGPARTLAMSAALSMATGLIVVRSQLARYFSEQPSYDVDMRLASPKGALEIRRYRGAVMAKTFVLSNLEGHGLDRPLEEGFNRLLAYISGQNEMTEKFAMTAPVLVEPRVGGSIISFFLPASRSLAAFPKPNDSRVDIEWSKSKRVAAVRYGGAFDATAPSIVGDQLGDALRSHAIEPIGETIFAGYDAPYVLPFLRRNEAWVEV
ncbi:MAG: heme-binding protein [Polyangiaceae bacterium]